jgi:hypothetical protein
MRTLTLTSLALAALTTAAAADPISLTDGQMDQVSAGFYNTQWAKQKNYNFTNQYLSQYVNTNAIAASGSFSYNTNAYASAYVNGKNNNNTYQSNYNNQ